MYAYNRNHVRNTTGPGLPFVGPLIAASLIACPVRGASGFAGFMDPRLGQIRPTARYTGFAYPDAGTDQGTDLGMNRHRLDVSAPVWQDDRNELSFNAAGSYLGIDSRARLHDAGADLPGDFWDAGAGASYRHRLENRWIVGGNLAFGSASDRPFHSYDEMTINASAILSIPVRRSDAAIFFLNYANNREFLPHVPIPGGGYLWRPAERVQAFAGIPVVWLMWRPTDEVSLRASYFPVRTVSARIGYSPLRPLELHGGFEWENMRHFRAGRRDEDDRVFYYEKRVSTGVKWRLGPAFSIDVRGGYAFDRFFFEGEEYGDRNDSRIDVDDGAFVGIEAAVEFGAPPR